MSDLENLTGLSPGTTYYYCALASNSVGTGFGAVSSFTTQDVPVVVTSAASGIGGTAATLNGTGDPNLGATTGYFRYSTTNPVTCNDTFGTRAPVSGGTSLGSGTNAVAFFQNLSGLTPGATYYFCAIATNGVGTGFGSVMSFFTPAAPAITTLAATPVTAFAATLNASGNPNSASTTGWFRYSTTNPSFCDDFFGTRAPASGGSALGVGASNVPFSQNIGGLSPGTTSYFCAIGQNSVGTTFGSVLTQGALSTPLYLVSTSVTTFNIIASASGYGTANLSVNVIILRGSPSLSIFSLKTLSKCHWYHSSA